MLPTSASPGHRRPKLLDQMRVVLRARHMSPKTESNYLNWVRRYILFHGKRHPAEMAEAEINAFLTHLATEKPVTTSTQSQALCALLFLYRHVLGVQIGELDDLVRARRPRKLPLVLTPSEIKRVLGCLRGTPRFVALAGAKLVGGTGSPARSATNS